MNKNIKITASECLLRGNSVVASIRDIKRIESAAIFYFRLWHDGDVSRKKIERNLTISHGYMKGYKSSKAIHDFCTLVFCEEFESFSILSIEEEFISADENCLSKLVFYTILGNDKDAINLANMLVPAESVFKLFFLAKDLSFLQR